MRQIVDGSVDDFALVHRGGEGVSVLTGAASTVERLADLPMPSGRPEDMGHRNALLAVMPYRQLRERGYACRDDGEPIRMLEVQHQGVVTPSMAVDLIPDADTHLDGLDMEVGDEAYGRTVARVLAEEIDGGQGANFVIHRSFSATVRGTPTRRAALAVFRRLLTRESGAYWTFVVHLGGRTLVGASPERHVRLAAGELSMNPISGTLRYPPGGPDEARVLDFLSDQKEADELHMVVDEELKMMARLCDGDIRLEGPHLREMARVAHTEYVLRGHSSAAPVEILRETMFAPTVMGSPVENAARVIARHEDAGRGYYSGVMALIGRDDDGAAEIDSAILIRTADLREDGSVRIGVGATLVRRSDPAAEAAETRAKAAALLAAFTGEAQHPTDIARPRLADGTRVRTALSRRNSALAPFWLGGDAGVPSRVAGPDGLRDRTVLVVDAEDRFTAMLAYQLRACGLQVVVRSYAETFDPDTRDLVVLGPGPGDPTDPTDPRVRALNDIGMQLLADRRPFLAVCLGHQVLAGLCGLAVRRRPDAQQGVQREIDLFGRRERVGFYNSFSAFCDTDSVASSRAGRVQVQRDAATGEVYALSGSFFGSMQFHPESILTRRGPAIVEERLRAVVAGPASR